MRLTIAEYAEQNNISVQAVYKKLKKLNTIKEERNGRDIYFILVDEDADPAAGEDKTQGLEDTKPISTNFNTNSTDNQQASKPAPVEIQQDTKPISTDNFNDNSTAPAKDDLSADVITTLKRIIEEKDKQIEEKDRQIERLQTAAENKDKQLQEQFDRFSSLLLRSQELEALTHKLLSAGETAPPQAEETTSPAPAPTEEEQPKKGWLRRFLGL